MSYKAHQNSFFPFQSVPNGGKYYLENFDSSEANEYSPKDGVNGPKSMEKMVRLKEQTLPVQDGPDSAE